MKHCSKCGNVIPLPRANKPNVKFCSDLCSSNYHTKSNGTAATNSINGTIAEYVATIDLIKKGWQVFAAVNGIQAVDLMVYKGDIKLKIQVKTGYINDAGTLKYSPLHNQEHDVLAVVLPDQQVIYIPSLD